MGRALFARAVRASGPRRRRVVRVVTRHSRLSCMLFRVPYALLHVVRTLPACRFTCRSRVLHVLFARLSRVFVEHTVFVYRTSFVRDIKLFVYNHSVWLINYLFNHLLLYK
jgi:hypothetical protein